MTDDPLKKKLKSIQSRAEAEPEKALAELRRIIEADSQSAEAWLLKASIHFGRDEHHLAAEAFAKVIKKKPKDGTASIGLFHSLWSSGKTDAAFEEMKRYFREAGLDHQSETATDYWAIVKEINQDT